jgi:hypothetical protein
VYRGSERLAARGWLGTDEDTQNDFERYALRQIEGTKTLSRA